VTDSTVRALELLEAQRDLRKCSAIDSYFPAGGPLSRELYAKHMDFFAAGLDHRERAFIAANRVGKTLAGAHESTLHLAGEYPVWWKGRASLSPRLVGRPVTVRRLRETLSSLLCMVSECQRLKKRALRAPLRPETLQGRTGSH